MKRTPIKRKTPLKAKALMNKASRPKITPIRDLWHLQAVIRTQRILIEQGLMEVAA